MMWFLALPHCKLGFQAAALPGAPATEAPAAGEAQAFLLMCRQLDSTVGGQASLSQFISGKKALVAFFYPRVRHKLQCGAVQAAL